MGDLQAHKDHRGDLQKEFRKKNGFSEAEEIWRRFFCRHKTLNEENEFL